MDDKSHLKGAGLDAWYQRSVCAFETATEKAHALSDACSGQQVEPKRWWAALLFTRLCTISASILSLTPRSSAAREGLHFDFSSIATLCRNYLEGYLAFFYLGVDDVNDQEWLCRLNVMQLHDCLSRHQMFTAFNPNDPQLPGFLQQAADLRLKLAVRPYFSSLPPKQQGRFLRGERAWLLSQDELLQRAEISVGDFRGLYTYLSAQAHSFPLSFYRMAERDQGRGVENDAEKGSIAMILEFVASISEGSIRNMEHLFPGSVDAS